MSITLSDLQTGDTGRISALQGGMTTYRRTLLAMGLIPGTCFTICRVAPLGDPIQVQVRGFQLSMRRYEAATIEVIRL